MFRSLSVAPTLFRACSERGRRNNASTMTLEARSGVGTLPSPNGSTRRVLRTGCLQLHYPGRPESPAIANTGEVAKLVNSSPGG